MQILELDPVVEEGSSVDNESVESLHIVCGKCFAVNPGCPALCGQLDEAPYNPEQEYQDCVVCFDMLEAQFCPNGHLIGIRG